MDTECFVCRVVFTTKPSRAARTKGPATCSRTCRGKLCETAYKGDKNPNKRHFYDTNFMNEIDSEEKAYLLGWIASDGHVSEGGVVIEVHSRDVRCMERLAQLVAGGPVSLRHERAAIRVSSVDWVKAICAHLSISTGKKSHAVRMPQLPNEKLKWAFIRGYFDGDGSISSLEAALRRSRFPYPRINIASNSTGMLNDLKVAIGSGNVYADKIEWNGAAALDVLAKMYDPASVYLSRKRNLYLDWSTWTPSLTGENSRRELDGFAWCKSRPDAVAPKKTRASDSGYDLVLLERVKAFGGVEMFDTGIKVQPPYGYYFDMVPRSSIIKSGYMLANSIGIIDQTYTGSILVPLVRICEGGGLPGPLQLPACLVQIVPRRIVHLQVVEVEELTDTVRGAGGFGSTGVST